MSLERLNRVENVSFAPVPSPHNVARLATFQRVVRLILELGNRRTQEAQAFDREVEAFSGRLTIVVPKSLHAALKREAMREGVSLSEPIRLKLGVAYRTMAQSLTAG